MVNGGKIRFNFSLIFFFMSFFTLLIMINPGAVCFAENGDVSSTFSIDVQNEVLQVTAPNVATIVLNPISSAAVFDSTSIIVNVATNNATGYAMTMNVPTTNLIHTGITGDNAPLIATLPATTSESSFPANAWGYSVVDDSYMPIRLSNTNTLWNTDGPTNGTDHVITLGAKVDGIKAAGIYENTLTFNVVANPNTIRNVVAFNGNGADGGVMDDQFVFLDSPIALHENTYTRTGYYFSGWNTKADGSGIGYGDKAFYSASAQDSAETVITLYAQWTSNAPICVQNCSGGGTPKYESSITIGMAYELAYAEHHLGMYEETAYGNGIYERVDAWNGEPYKNFDVRFAMQDIDLTYNSVKVCDLVTVIGDHYQALDVRDNKLYWISKLADGKCWMTQNLDLDLNSNTTLSSETTDLNLYNDSGYANGYSINNDIISWTPINSTIALSGTSISGWGRSNYEAYSGDRGDIYHYLSETSSTPFTENGKHGHEGNFYSYSAAVASNDSTNIRKPNEEAANSICPSGWRLPLASTNEYMNLYDLYGGTMLAIESSPLYMIRAGMADAYSYRLRQNEGWYINNNLYPHNSPMYYVGTCYNSFSFNDNNNSVRYWCLYCDNPGRALGQSIRCVAR